MLILCRQQSFDWMLCQIDAFLQTDASVLRFYLFSCRDVCLLVASSLSQFWVYLWVCIYIYTYLLLKCSRIHHVHSIRHIRIKLFYILLFVIFKNIYVLLLLGTSGYNKISFSIAASLGTSICLDNATSKREEDMYFGHYVRILVDINLNNIFMIKLLFSL